MISCRLEIKAVFCRAFFILLVLLMVPSMGYADSEEKDYDAAWKLCQARKYPEAVEGFKKFLSKHSKGKYVVEARFTLARIETSGNNAFGHYQFIIDNYPEHALASQAAYATAQYMQNAGSTSQARDRYFFVYSKYGNSPAGRESLSRLAVFALDCDSLGKAEAYINAYLEKYPKAIGGADLLNRLAVYHQKRGRSAEAKVCWQKIVGLFQGTPESVNANESLLAEPAEGDSAITASGDIASSLPDSNTTLIIGDTTKLVPDRPMVIIPLAKPNDIRATAITQKIYLQVGAYKNIPAMKGLEKKLNDQGIKTVVQEVGSGRETTYKLQVGPFDNRSETKKPQESINTKFGIKAMVVER